LTGLAGVWQRRRVPGVRVVAALVAALLVAGPAGAAEWVVTGSGGDFTSVQAALDVAVAGDTIKVHANPTPYFEKVVFPRSGSAVAGWISLEAWPGERPVLDGTGVTGADMVLIDSRSWVRIQGFEIRNDLDVNDGSGVRVLGSGSHIEIRDNDIHDIRGRHAMGITVYATEVDTPISDLVIDGNVIHDCEPFQSEALTLNGNVDGFQVTNNVVRDVNNIGIDFIGGETDIVPDKTKVARNGVCRGNRVERARQENGGWAGGIYVDGGRDIVLENNVVTESDLGIEVGAENQGVVTSGIVVRNNVVYANEKAGIVFGGYRRQAGRVEDSEFRNNTCWHNDTLGVGSGELWIQWAENNVVRDNVFVATAQNRLLTSDDGNVNNVLDYNLWWIADGPAAALFTWNGDEYTGFDAYRTATGQDAHSPFAAPLFGNEAGADFHLRAVSPAIDAGDPATVPAAGETDLDGAARLTGPAVDIGADEGCANGCC
jgi:Right handed beta helix region